MDPTVLLNSAADWLAHAMRQHLQEAPEQCREWIRAHEQGAAIFQVLVDVVPEQQVRCAVQFPGRADLIVFHCTKISERAPAPEKLN